MVLGLSMRGQHLPYSVFIIVIATVIATAEPFSLIPGSLYVCHLPLDIQMCPFLKCPCIESQYTLACQLVNTSAYSVAICLSIEPQCILACQLANAFAYSVAIWGSCRNGFILCTKRHTMQVTGKKGKQNEECNECCILVQQEKKLWVSIETMCKLHNVSISGELVMDVSIEQAESQNSLSKERQHEDTKYKEQKTQTKRGKNRQNIGSKEWTRKQQTQVKRREKQIKKNSVKRRDSPLSHRNAVASNVWPVSHVVVEFNARLIRPSPGPNQRPPRQGQVGGVRSFPASEVYIKLAQMRECERVG
ncbi:hypothetical protein B0H19DRAFT_1064940 [Mycena capillaripes]|nr:hypothetical protein B0H19DRAFT_1064940 [Mycena capillaripes]